MLEPLGLAVLVIGLALTAVLALTAQSLYDHEEGRLLDLRLRDAGAVLSGALPAIQTPLASAATLAAATNGDVARFDRLIAPYVAAHGPFVSASLWSVRGADARRVATIGAVPLLASQPARERDVLIGAARASALSVSGLLDQATPRLGYAYAATTARGAYVAYGESALPPDRFSRIPPGVAFSDLNYALYLGRSAQPADLLETNVAHPPLGGTHAALQVPLGDASLDLVMSPRVSLSGGLFEWRAQIIAGVGLLVSLVAALVAQQLVRRRRRAEDLARRLDGLLEENRQLYSDQREISLTLQNALLPRTLPSVPGLDVEGRYVPAVAEMAIGGDWYDIISIDARRTLFVLGDVSGHGAAAATGMAALRYAIRAYAQETSSPAAILEKLGRLLDIERDHQLATVLCGVIDCETDELTIACAGHPPPLLIDAGGSEYVTSRHGPPIGVERAEQAGERTVPFPPGTTLLAYSDGLVERRGETIDAGLERLRHSARHGLSLETLLDTVIGELAPDGRDDIALLGIRRAARPARRDPSRRRRPAPANVQ